MDGGAAAIGTLRFPCPECSEPVPIDLASAEHATVFTCAAAACNFSRALGPTFPGFRAIVASSQDVDDATIRQRVIDAMSAWFFDWSAPTD